MGPSPSPVGDQCASYPPANFYTCCANKAASGEYDTSCPSMNQACDKWPSQSFDACCEGGRPAVGCRMPCHAAVI